MKKTVAKRKTTTKRKPSLKSKKSKSSRVRFYLLILFAILFLGLVFHFREGLSFYFKQQFEDKINNDEDSRVSDIRNFKVLNKYKDKVVGFDVSQFQGKINWSLIDSVEHTYPLKFVFIRATAGADKLDRQFINNWIGAKKNKIIRGAYHYYRPNENSLKQAQLFIANVNLTDGDLPPVLDIERLPKNQSIDSLKIGLKRWLKVVDNYYKVKPIIYTSESYYNDFLKEEFKEYPFWIANYNFFTENIKDNWLFWQFTEKASVSGIKGNVDLNIYNGTPKMLQYMTVVK